MKVIKDKNLKPGMIVTDVNIETSEVLPCYFEVMKVDDEERRVHLKFIKHPNGTAENDYLGDEEGLTEFGFSSDKWYLVEEIED